MFGKVRCGNIQIRGADATFRDNITGFCLSPGYSHRGQAVTSHSFRFFSGPMAKYGLIGLLKDPKSHWSHREA